MGRGYVTVFAAGCTTLPGSTMSSPTSSFAAPWGRSLKVMSLVATLLLGGVALLEAVVLPRDLLGGWPWLAGTFLPLAILALSLLFVVRGYSLSPGYLHVQRLLWQTAVPLDSLRAAWASPEATSGSLRLFGNGGLYSITGGFRNSRLGRYRAFVTDPRLAVVLDFGDRKAVVTPDSPAAFLAALQLVCPAVELEPAAPS